MDKGCGPNRPKRRRQDDQSEREAAHREPGKNAAEGGSGTAGEVFHGRGSRRCILSTLIDATHPKQPCTLKTNSTVSGAIHTFSADRPLTDEIGLRYETTAGSVFTAGEGY